MEKTKSGQLIDHLMNGGVLVKKYNRPTNEAEYIMFDFRYTEPYLERRGWGSAMGSKESVIVEVVTKPDLWEIVENEDYDSIPVPFMKDAVQKLLTQKHP